MMRDCRLARGVEAADGRGDDIGEQEGSRPPAWAWPAASVLIVGLVVFLVVSLAPRRTRLEASSLVIRDRAGRERITLDASGRDGEARLTIRDGKQRARVVVAVEHNGSAGAWRFEAVESIGTVADGRPKGGE